jgi:hypothetical protein
VAIEDIATKLTRPRHNQQIHCGDYLGTVCLKLASTIRPQFGLVIGPFWLAALIKDERRRRWFFEGPYEYEEDKVSLFLSLWVVR